MMLNHLPRPLLSTSPRCAENQVLVEEEKRTQTPGKSNMCVCVFGEPQPERAKKRVNVQAAGSIDTALPSQQPLFWRRPAPIGVCSALASPIFLSQINLGPFSALFLSGCACSWGRQGVLQVGNCGRRLRDARQVLKFQCQCKFCHFQSLLSIKNYRTCHNRNKISRSKRQVCRFALPKEASSDPQPNSRFIRFNQRTPGEETPAPIAALRASGTESADVYELKQGRKDCVDG
ncbi:hypothetical protein QQF64_013060 [Cirrhinus molitorella]|uniref:Uncharacterized protein n=1 Tax=Cirrhinus molitorella TaxID=172907 RepID=A0ABR3LTJ0_9TELE